MASCACFQQVVTGRTHLAFKSVATRSVTSLSRSLSGVPALRKQCLAPRQNIRNRSSAAATVMAAAGQTLYDFTAKDIDGNDVQLSKYQGNVLLVVNVASECGFTPQYKGLGELEKKYGGRGFAVLAFPCNQFGGQEPGNNQQIKNFAASKGATFQLFDKVDVNGSNASPVWEYMKNAKPGLLGSSGIKWNFGKFLVNKTGEVVKRYGSTTAPEDIQKDIEALL